MANQWFRLYAEFATDPKVQMMTEAMQRRYIMLLCMRCSNSLVTLHDEEVAFQLRISAEELAETKALFIKKGFIDSSWDLPNWEKRQFASDTSAARVAKHRALQKEKQQAQSNDDVTLQKQKCNALEQNRTEQIQNRTEKKSSAVAQPDGVSDSVWQDFKAIRKTKKAALTDTALNLIRSQAAKAGVTLQAALEVCCERGWSSYNAEWVTTKPTYQQQQAITTPSRPGIDPTLASLIKEQMSGAVKPPSDEIRQRMKQLSGARA